MSSSVKYWRLPEEERYFIGYVDSIEPTVAISSKVFPRVEDLHWKKLEEAFASDDDSYLITPSRYLPQVCVISAEDATGVGVTIDVVTSPTLFYYRGQLMGTRRLSSTALTADWTYLAEDGVTIKDQPADFVRWAKRVMQWVRRAAPGWHQHKAHRITEKAEAARQAGLELIS